MIAEDQWCRTSAAETTIQNNVVGTGCERKVYVVLNVVRRRFEPDRNATRPFANFIRDAFEIRWRFKVWEG